MPSRADDRVRAQARAAQDHSSEAGELGLVTAPLPAPHLSAGAWSRGLRIAQLNLHRTELSEMRRSWPWVVAYSDRCGRSSDEPAGGGSGSGGELGAADEAVNVARRVFRDLQRLARMTWGFDDDHVVGFV
jgi:hypothetical protein